MIYKHELFLLTVDPQPILYEVSVPKRKEVQLIKKH